MRPPHILNTARRASARRGGITPYFWLASVANDIGDATLNANVGQLVKMLHGALMVNTQAQYKNFGLSGVLLGIGAVF